MVDIKDNTLKEEKSEDKPEKVITKESKDKLSDKPVEEAIEKPEKATAKKDKKERAKKEEETKEVAKKTEEKAVEESKKEEKKAEKPEKKGKEKTEKTPAKKEEMKEAVKKTKGEAIEKPKSATAKKDKKEHAKKEEKKEVAKKTEKEPLKEPKKVAKKEKPGHKIEKITFYEKRKLTGVEKRLFKVAGIQKKKKPKFARQELSFRKKLADVWRRPRGIDSKQQEEKRGKGKVPKIGYGHPNSVSGLHPTGYKPVMVHNVSEIEGIDHKVEAAIISATVGRKKRNEIILVANRKRIVILNPRKGEINTRKDEIKDVSKKKLISGKNILMIIAPENFRDEELKTPKDIFENNGAKVTIASTGTKVARGQRGMKVKPDITISEVNVDDYDTVIFVGGTGAQEHLWDNESVRNLAKEFNKKGKLTGAICLAPVILAKAGILKNKTATVFKSDDTMSEFESNNVKYSKRRVVVSDNIITGNGPEAANEFAGAVVEAMK
ncbi:MAG: 50S ribosomal protein L32e [Candidatus Altiarchaeales archaeon HGW-Altiarchaeales-3]|nr:MAG: 50S ribosomal protein L32e [Candidatus Altiarchaeales archaeon HGW-Altiarchaeales-3]